MTSALGLRDRKKAATRAALSGAAVRLAKEFGLESVTSEAIAAEAGVSTRTFHNYFASKEEAVLHEIELEIQGWVEMLRNRPADEPILDSFEYIAHEVVSAPLGELEEMCAVPRLLEETPALMAKHVQDNVSRMFGEVIAERTGTNIDRDLYPNLIQVAVGGTMKTVLELAVSGNAGDRSPQQLVTEAFALVRNGFPQPATLMSHRS
ncbi:TetR/AcrR family transcriptional regulator [Aldersonia sp. NBC_00410]|uniref:TetR/AcrR family transcriptional regulator n=1 Tax=Aldersonia sp. NBC_00410 TaxID=2975954 RepID=UPI002255CA72|nr:TetR/AcrR family transcriptional regulator [Aldersonia sp. NBC_00410]MCX5042120.1 TetR/AcrR family transcriptional regulator [Aldersonia sp. NBC_00410]